MFEVPVWLWSYILTAIGVTGLYISSKKYAWGFLVGLGAQVLWVAYALATDQHGFLISAFFYGWMYARNFKAWRQPKPATLQAA